MATRSTRCTALPPKWAACATNHAATSTQTAVQRSRWPVAMLTFSEASARILFMQDDLLSAAGGEPCSEDCPSTPETTTPSSRETSQTNMRSRSEPPTSPYLVMSTL